MTDQVAPVRPSNRAVIERLVAWGCKRRSGKGIYDEFHLPSGEWVMIPREGTDKGASRYTLSRICLAWGMSWDEWWFAKPHFVDSRHAKPEPRFRDIPDEQWYQPTPVPGVEEKTEVQREEEAMPKQRQYGTSAKVLQVIVDHREEGLITNQRLAELIPELTTSQIYAGTYTLRRNGLIKNKGRGIYQLAQEFPPHVRVGVQVTGPTSTPVLVPEISGTDTTHTDDIVGARVIQESAPRDDDSDIEAVLDLLMPEGIKAAHLTLVTNWVNDTRRMLKQVRG